jgi:Spx/MgsR family transcriptional regulator
MAAMLKIYGIKNCSSMKKAFDLLTEQGLSYEFHDYKKQGIDAETVKIWLDALGQDVVLNKKGTTWRKLGEEEQQTALSSEDALINALTTHTSLIKRPILATSTGFIAGFDETVYRGLNH